MKHHAPSPTLALAMSAAVLFGVLSSLWGKALESPRAQVTTTQPPASEDLESPFDSRQAPLGCFNAKGQWTQDRNTCATDQSAFINAYLEVNPSAFTITKTGTGADLVAWAAIDALFMNAESRAEKITALKTVTQTALDAVTDLQKRERVPEDIQTAVRGHAGKLRSFLADIDGLTVPVIDDRIAGARTEILALSQTFSAIPPAASVPTDGEMQAILTRLDRIIQNTARVEDLTRKEGIILAASAAASLEAAEQSLAVARACGALSHCTALAKTAEAILAWRDAVQAAVTGAGRTDLLVEIGVLID